MSRVLYFILFHKCFTLDVIGFDLGQCHALEYISHKLIFYMISQPKCGNRDSVFAQH
jgi:hypothetical protein